MLYVIDLKATFRLVGACCFVAKVAATVVCLVVTDICLESGK